MFRSYCQFYWFWNIKDYLTVDQSDRQGEFFPMSDFFIWNVIFMTMNINRGIQNFLVIGTFEKKNPPNQILKLWKIRQNIKVAQINTEFKDVFVFGKFSKMFELKPKNMQNFMYFSPLKMWEICEVYWS